MTPVGLKFAPWGHNSNRHDYFEKGRISNFRRLAYLTGDGRFLYNWHQTLPEGKLSGHRIWTEFTLEALCDKPESSPESDPVGLFPLCGTVMAGTQPPSSPDAYENSVGMIFVSRPLGAYSHTFACENSFHLYGYGQDLSFAGRTTLQEPHSFHTISHNTVLIDGYGQSQLHPPETPNVGFLRAFHRGEDYVYWAGDATNAYPKYPLVRPSDLWPMHDIIYRFRALSYLNHFVRHVVFVNGKYFVMFDDLGCDKPAKYSWLYHILPDDPIKFDNKKWTIYYIVGDVPVRIAHMAYRDNLELLDMKGNDGFNNPFTDEDFTHDLGRADHREEQYIAGHNLYISNVEKKKTFHFLSVIAPAKPGEDFPVIRYIDDWTVEVDGVIVGFNPDANSDADILVDIETIRGARPVIGGKMKVKH